MSTRRSSPRRCSTTAIPSARERGVAGRGHDDGATAPCGYAHARGYQASGDDLRTVAERTRRATRLVQTNRPSPRTRREGPRPYDLWRAKLNQAHFENRNSVHVVVVVRVRVRDLFWFSGTFSGSASLGIGARCA